VTDRDCCVWTKTPSNYQKQKPDYGEEQRCSLSNSKQASTFTLEWRLFRDEHVVPTGALLCSNTNFAAVRDLLASKNSLGKVNALLADLGLSSMQIDNPARGFTFKASGSFRGGEGGSV
jgi:hypothetical protein